MVAEFREHAGQCAPNRWFVVHYEDCGGVVVLIENHIALLCCRLRVVDEGDGESVGNQLFARGPLQQSVYCA